MIAGKEITVEVVLIEARKGNRVCPQPAQWQQLYEMLPNRQRKGAGWEPALPLILAAWHETPAPLKMLRLREQEWHENRRTGSWGRMVRLGVDRPP